MRNIYGIWAQMRVKSLSLPCFGRPLRAAALAMSALVAAGFSGPAAADDGALTTFATNKLIVLKGSYTPPRDAQVGAILQDKEGVVVDGAMQMTGGPCTLTKLMTVNGTQAPGLEKTYKTNVPGIGVRFYTTQGWGGGWELAPVNTKFTAPRNSTAKWLVTAELLVIGPVSGGALTSFPSLDVQFINGCGNPGLTYHVTIAAGSRVVQGGCLVTTPSVVATLPPLTSREFNTVGATRGDTPLRIGLNCTPGANVYVTLTDSTNPGNRTDRLTPAAGSTAGGIEMRLLYKGKPVAYGPDSAAAGAINQWRVGTSDSVTEVPLVAQYISTGAVTPGTLRGIATFTMSYQ